MTDRECTQACAAKGAQFVLVSDGKVCKLTNLNVDLKTHAGHTVNLPATSRPTTSESPRSKCREGLTLHMAMALGSRSRIEKVEDCRRTYRKLVRWNGRW
jgi:hypothetical protein